MGRYYSGDVEGKFMFAVQPSNAHERFGAVEYEPNYISYTIDRVNKMFKENNGYNDEIMKQYNVSKKDLSEYADYRLGEQVKNFFDDNPDEYECNFEAEP